MPKELRKRGKKKKGGHNSEDAHCDTPPPRQAPDQTPSWIIKPEPEPVNPDAPFGEVDLDVKAYFRTVDLQIRDWQEPADAENDVDPNEERRLFFVAALNEMHGKEKQLATDPECSIILERMTYSMDDFVRRVFVDSLAGSFEVLAKNRFASHVYQTLFTIAGQTIAREQRGVFPTLPDGKSNGELCTLTQLVLDLCEEILPTFPSLLIHPFASHVMRSLLLLLSPSVAAKQDSGKTAMRSKKSAKWKARQGPLKSVFESSANESSAFNPPVSFGETARKLVHAVRDELDENETRALAANQVASPTLQIMLAVEAEQQMSDEHDSLMDRVLVGLVSASRENPDDDFPDSDFVGTLLRDPTSSHLLETIVSECPPAAFSNLWKIYFQNSLPRLASHPVANFVVAKALERVDVAQLASACESLKDVWAKMLQNSRTGVLRAAIDRAAALKACGDEVTQALWDAIQATTPEERNLLVPAMLRLQTVQDFKTSQTTENDHKRKRDSETHEPTVQGAVLLQSLLRLPEPFNMLVIESLNSLPMEETLALTKNPISSRVLDVLLESPTVPAKAKRQFVQSFIGHYHLLVDDRIGSRVGDRCWAFADTYLKEKIARSLFSQESFLAGSYYGKFFAKNLNLYLLQRRPEEWKTMQASKNKPTAEPVPLPPPIPKDEEHDALPPRPAKKRKQNRDAAKDEIDELFAGKLGKKVKKGALSGVALEGGKRGDFGLTEVMGAIRAAPGEGKGRR